MQKPKDYDAAPLLGEYVPLELGGHYLTIRNVQEATTKAGDPMLVIQFDTAKTDKQPDYFQSQFAADQREEKRWPVGGTNWLTTSGTYGTSRLKSFVTAVEKSNPGFTVNWDATDFGGQFKDRRVGGIFQKEIDWYAEKNKETEKVRLFRWTETGKVSTAPIPPDTESPAHKEAREHGVIGKPRMTMEDIAKKTENGDWMNIPDTLAEELPFS